MRPSISASRGATSASGSTFFFSRIAKTRDSIRAGQRASGWIRFRFFSLHDRDLFHVLVDQPITVLAGARAEGDGYFPDDPGCNNIPDFWNAICHQQDLVDVASSRYPDGFDGLPSRAGLLPKIASSNSTHSFLESVQRKRNVWTLN